MTTLLTSSSCYSTFINFQHLKSLSVLNPAFYFTKLPFITYCNCHFFTIIFCHRLHPSTASFVLSQAPIPFFSPASVFDYNSSPILKTSVFITFFSWKDRTASFSMITGIFEHKTPNTTQMRSIAVYQLNTAQEMRTPHFTWGLPLENE